MRYSDNEATSEDILSQRSTEDIYQKIEKFYNELFSKNWSCCKIKGKFFADDFKFRSGNLLISILHRELVEGIERSSASDTSFILNLSTNEGFIFPNGIKLELERV